MKKEWQKLSYDQQKVYKDKAAYLIDRGLCSQQNCRRTCHRDLQK
jgi:hypothetical protein